MKKSFILLIFFGLIFSLFSPWAWADSFQEMVNQAIKLENNKRWQEAALWTEEIIRKHPNHKRLPEAYSWLVYYWTQAKQWEKSKATCFTILEKFPHDVHYVGFANRSLALHFYRENNREEGQKYAKAYIETFPDTPEAKAIASAYGFRKRAEQSPPIEPTKSTGFTRTFFQSSFKDLLNMKVTKENFLPWLAWIGGIFLIFVVGFAFLLYYINKDEITPDEY